MDFAFTAVFIALLFSLWGGKSNLLSWTAAAIAGITQIISGMMMIIGFYTRIAAALLALMGIITIIIPGIIIMKDVPHFAYAFATAGGAIALLIRGSGAYSLDARLWRRQKLASSVNQD